jgi:hypothetical protein
VPTIGKAGNVVGHVPSPEPELGIAPPVPPAMHCADALLEMTIAAAATAPSKEKRALEDIEPSWKPIGVRANAMQHARTRIAADSEDIGDP